MLDVGSVRNRVDDLFPFIDYLVCAEEYALHYFTPGRCFGRYLDFGRWAFRKWSSPAAPPASYGVDAGGQPIFQKAYKVAAVDVTGAGDVFHGAYLFGIRKKWDLAYKLKFASAAAALKCRQRGARDGIPTFDETITFMKRHRTFYA